jgi:hypothetical protein
MQKTEDGFQDCGDQATGDEVYMKLSWSLVIDGIEKLMEYPHRVIAMSLGSRSPETRIRLLTKRT